MRSLPNFSVVIEWENAKLAGAERATRMLRELVNQASALADHFAKPPELIVVYDGAAVPRETVEAAIVAGGAEDAFEVRLHAAEGSDYYGQKNEGAQIATRDYVLFLDSDIVPEAGWLQALLGSPRPGVEVVAGSTYVETDTALGRAFSLFWFFPLRGPSNGLRETRAFFANNVIINRKLFLSHRFPDLPLYRGQCTVLCAKLLQSGVKLYLQTDARVAHPPPNRKHFIHRALCEGHDAITAPQVTDQPAGAGGSDLPQQLANLEARVRSRLPHVSFEKQEVATAMKLGQEYCRLRAAGQRWATRSPERARQALGIRPMPTSLPLNNPVIIRLDELPDRKKALQSGD
jgi:hypothetical protein